MVRLGAHKGLLISYTYGLSMGVLYGFSGDTWPWNSESALYIASCLVIYKNKEVSAAIQRIHMGVIASRISKNLTVFPNTTKITPKLCITDPLWGNQGRRWPLESPHKGPVTREAFPCYDVIVGNSPPGGPLVWRWWRDQHPVLRQRRGDCHGDPRSTPCKHNIDAVPIIKFLCHFDVANDRNANIFYVFEDDLAR